MFFFFFSSRRRHTRCSRDWSSDVCSSDLVRPPPVRRSPAEDGGAVTCRVRLPSASNLYVRSQTSLARSLPGGLWTRSEEHTSELQSRLHLVCRLLLEKKKITLSISTALSA